MQCNAMQCLHSIVLTTLTNHVASIRLGKPITTSVAKESEWTSGIKSTEILNSDWLTAPTHVIMDETLNSCFLIRIGATLNTKNIGQLYFGHRNIGQKLSALSPVSEPLS